MEGIDWEATLYKVLKKCSENKLPIKQACRKAAKRAQKKSAQDRHLLLSQVETFLSKAGSKGRVFEKNGTVSLSERNGLQNSKGAEQQASLPAQESQPLAKKRKITKSVDHKAASDTGGLSLTVDPNQQPKSGAHNSGAKNKSSESASKNHSLDPKKKLKKGKETSENGTTPSQPLASSSKANAQNQVPAPETASLEPKKKKKEKDKAANSEQAASLKASKGSSEDCSSDKKKGKVKGPDEAMPKIKDDTAWRESRKRKDVKHGRFSKAEKDALKEGATAYAQEMGLDDLHFDWLFQTKTGEQKELTNGAWKAIASGYLPHRSVRSVWSCGTRILHPNNYKGAWTSDEIEKLKQLVEEKGQKWRAIGDEMGRLPTACRDRYREASTQNESTNKGAWSAEECQALQEAVEEYIHAKQEQEEKLASPMAATLSLEDMPTPAQEEGVDDNRALLDDVDWKAVALKVGTRSRVQCMIKWYRHLAPSMVTQGEWGLGDDRKLLKGLLMADARQMFLAPWDDVVKGRTAQQARRRWNLMVKRVPDAYEKSFSEQLDYLVDTFAPGLRHKVEAMRQPDFGTA